jgi:hypothetical protein
VRTPEVVGLHEERDPTLAILEVGKDRPREKLLPQRLPETLDLPQRLGMVRPALDVPDPLAAQLLLEVRVPAPGHVLAPLVRQHLARRPVLGNPPRQRLQYQRRALVVRHHQGHQVPRVVVHEGGHVQTLMPPQEKREDVRLPELIRLRALESMLGRTRLGHCLGYFLQQTFFVEDPPHRRLRHPQPLEARHHVPDAPRPLFGVLTPGLHHRRTPRILRSPIRPRLRFRRPFFRPPLRVRPVLPVPARPLRHRRSRDAKGLGHRRLGHPPIDHRLRHLKTHFGRPFPMPGP